MTRRVAELLLAVAQRRWPVELRADLHREWDAELHVLAERRQRLPMLRFAASLAARRSGVDAADHVPIGRRLLRTALPLLLAPVAGAGIVFAGLVVMQTVVAALNWRGGLWAYELQLPIASAVTAAGAVGLALLADRLARAGSPRAGWRTTFGIVAPVGLTVAVLGYLVFNYADAPARVAPGLVLWLAGLALVLRGAARLAGRGRVRAAWWLGVLGAVAVADAATILAVLGQVPTGAESVVDGVPQGDTPDPVSAPLWLLVCLTDSALGLPRPTGQEIFLITDAVLLEPLLYLACTPYALAWAIRAARGRAAPATGPAAPEPVVRPS